MNQYKFWYVENGKEAFLDIEAISESVARELFFQRKPEAHLKSWNNVEDEKPNAYYDADKIARLSSQLYKAYDEYIRSRVVAAQASQAHQETFLQKEHAHALADLALQKLEALQLQYVEILAKGNE